MRRHVAFQGERGAFGEEAIAAVWPNEAEPVPLPTFADVVRAVADGRVAAGVLPIENSIAGPVHESIAALSATNAVHIVGESVVPVTLCLLAPDGASLGTLRSVESHPVALAQCRAFLARHPWITAVSVGDTAQAARDVAAAGEPGRGAVAARSAALRYGLTILAEGIEDERENRTRFVIITRGDHARPGPASTRERRRFHAVRGATTVEADDSRLIREATRELLQSLLHRNGVRDDQIVSALFSTTGDLTSEFPARAARELGWGDVALMCMTEIPVPGSLARCIRVLLHVELEHPRAPLSPVYLRGAESLRLDIVPLSSQTAAID
jgi:prephenate dehydratase